MVIKRFRRITLLRRRIIIFIALFFVIASCSYKNDDSVNGCKPPHDFIENDLIGTWVSGLPVRRDSITLFENGTYKQVIQSNDQAIYESQLNKWRLEESSLGVPYLYLEHMRLCVYWDGIDCDEDKIEGKRFYDFCEDEWIELKNEGILIVLGPPTGFDHPDDQITFVALMKSTHRATGYRKE